MPSETILFAIEMLNKISDRMKTPRRRASYACVRKKILEREMAHLATRMSYEEAKTKSIVRMRMKKDS